MTQYINGRVEMPVCTQGYLDLMAPFLGTVSCFAHPRSRKALTEAQLWYRGEGPCTNNQSPGSFL